MMIECRWCGKLFKPTSNAQKYCLECRDSPEVTRERARERKQKYLEKRLSEKHWLPVFEDKPKKTCLICGSEFNPASNRQKWCLAHRKQGRQDARTRYVRKYRSRKRQGEGGRM